jgi:hypothetical protein
MSFRASTTLGLAGKMNRNRLIHRNRHTSSRYRSRGTVLRREQWEQLENNLCEDWTIDEQREQLESSHREDWTTD